MNRNLAILLLAAACGGDSGTGTVDAPGNPNPDGAVIDGATSDGTASDGNGSNPDGASSDGTATDASGSTPVAPSQAGDLVITEYMQNPGQVSDLNGEWFEVYNATGQRLQLLGLVMSDAGTESHTIASSVIVEPGAYAVLGHRADPGTNGGISNMAYECGWMTPEFALGNATDAIVLKMGGVTIDRIDYSEGVFPDDSDVNPGGGDYTGYSAALSSLQLSHTANDTGSNWCHARASDVFGDGDRGTPGAANPSCQ